MARPIKPEAFATKRKKILDAAQKLVFTKGYEQMSVRDILEELQISSGAFHHYFGSREELLEGMIERMKAEVERPLLPIIHDPRLTAIQKVQGFFDTLDRLRTERQAEITEVAKIWYNDSNAIVRLKVDEATVQQRAPLLAEIVRQGVREEVFTTTHPEQAGEVILTLLQGMANTHARLLLSVAAAKDGQLDTGAVARQIVAVHAAYMEAVERVLGAPPNSFTRTNVDAVQVWVEAAKSG